MNKVIAAGRWRQLKGKIREQWGRLTGDEVDQIRGRYENLIGTIQEKYGLARDEADEHANSFLAGFEVESDTRPRAPNARPA